MTTRRGAMIGLLWFMVLGVGAFLSNTQWPAKAWAQVRTMTIRRAGVEDLKYGVGTFDRLNSTGGLNTLHKISPINVLAFGVTGDGVTDDTDSLQAVIDYVGVERGGAVYLPSGRYKLSSALSVDNDSLAIVGDGPSTVIVLSATVDTAISVRGAQHCTIKDLSFLGDDEFADYTVGLHAPAIAAYYSHGMLVENVTVTAHPGAVYYYYCNDSRIASCTHYGFLTEDPVVSSAGSSSFEVSGGSRNVISNCVAKDWGDGVLVGLDADYTIASGNRFSNMDDDGLYFSSGSHNQAIGNTVYFVRSSTGIKMRGSYNVVSGNIVDSCYVGIAITGNGADAAGDSCNGYGIVCADNSITGCTYYGIYVDKQDDLVACGVVVTGNTISRTPYHASGIPLAARSYLTGAARRFVISNNMIYHENAADTALAGIYLQGVSTAHMRDVVVTGNVIHSSVDKFRYGIRASFVDDLTISNNNISGSYAEPYSFPNSHFAKGFVYDVLEWGATGDGTTDDTAAIQAAIDAAEAAGRGEVLLPPGSYRTTATMTIRPTGTTWTSNNLVFNFAQAEIVADTTLNDPVLKIGDSTGNTNHVTVYGGIIRYAGSARNYDPETTGITLERAYNCEIDGLTVYGAYKGVELIASNGGCVYNRVRVDKIWDCVFGIYLENTATGWVNDNTFDGGSIYYSSSVAAIDLSGGAAIYAKKDAAATYAMVANKFLNMSLEANDAAIPDDKLAKAILLKAWDTNVFGCRFEGFDGSADTISYIDIDIGTWGAHFVGGTELIADSFVRPLTATTLHTERMHRLVGSADYLPAGGPILELLGRGGYDTGYPMLSVIETSGDTTMQVTHLGTKSQAFWFDPKGGVPAAPKVGVAFLDTTGGDTMKVYTRTGWRAIDWLD